jgi:VWFA-related protein
MLRQHAWFCCTVFLAGVCAAAGAQSIPNTAPVFHFDALPPAAAVVFTAEAPPAGPPSPELSSLETIHRDVDEVRLIFSVRKRDGRFVSDLTQEEVDVLDDERAPDKINFFQAQTDLPLRIGLVIDVSDSITERFRFEQNAAVSFLRRTLRPATDEAFVVAFNSAVKEVQGWTSDSKRLETAIRSLHPGGSTALYDAVAHAALQMGMASKRSERRVIVLITDGMDNQSKATLQRTIETALRCDVVVYALSTNSTYVNQSGDVVLTQLAGATGGRVLRADGDHQISRAFESIQRELRSQYMLAYKPADFKADGRYRTIRVRSRKRVKLLVQARRGYFAPRAPSM